MPLTITYLGHSGFLFDDGQDRGRLCVDPFLTGNPQAKHTPDDIDADYVINAVRFVARAGHRFLSRYRFDPLTGSWMHEEASEPQGVLSLTDALEAAPLGTTALPAPERARRYAAHLAEAERLGATLAPPVDAPGPVLDGRFGALQFFST